MPKPMKVKMFTDQKASEVERQINAWLDNLGSAVIVTSQTVVTAITEKSEDGTCPYCRDRVVRAARGIGHHQGTHLHKLV
jgi:hypothetical protein